MDYDYIVVGGGTSGCIVASRLAESGYTVLILESGEDGRSIYKVNNLKEWSQLLGTKYDYDYSTNNTQGVNQKIKYSRGKLLGGCSSHNSCIAFKVPDYDLNEWVKHGAIGWEPRSMDRFFNKVYQKITIESAKLYNPFINDFFDASINFGLNEIKFSEKVSPGIGWFDLNKKGLFRQSSTIYLPPKYKKPSKCIKIYTNTIVTKIILNNNRAVGVETTMGKYYARNEIILCCGSIDTPKLLLLSGIGPKEHLESLNINTEIDLPGVGSHLLDHPECVINWELNQEMTTEYINNWEVGIFSKSSICKELEPFDMMLHLGTTIFDMNTSLRGYPTAKYGFSLTPNVCRARSEGTIRLRSKDPFDDPIISLNYFSDLRKYDDTIMLEGFKLAREIAKQEPLKKWIKQELTPGLTVQSDVDILKYLHETCNTVYHASGTCKMGFTSDPMSVVNNELKVKFISGLRIADASIFPTMIGVNPNITIMAIGEKCAELIKVDLIRSKL